LCLKGVLCRKEKSDGELLSATLYGQAGGIKEEEEAEGRT